MLRPKSGLLGSSRAERRANVRAERVKALGQAARGTTALAAGMFGASLELVLLWGLPLAYLAASYLVLDLPMRWLFGKEHLSIWTLLFFLGSLALCLVGLVRMATDAEPIAPVRPRFAKTMMALSWLTGLLLTIGDLAS